VQDDYIDVQDLMKRAIKIVSGQKSESTNKEKKKSLVDQAMVFVALWPEVSLTRKEISKRIEIFFKRRASVQSIATILLVLINKGLVAHPKDNKKNTGRSDFLYMLVES